MTTPIDQIGSTAWQSARGRLGEVVVDLEDFEQCINTILQTRKRSCPHRPEFGCDAHLYLDQPVNVARPNIVREAVDAIAMWETRVIVDRVLVVPLEAGFKVSVVWLPAAGLGEPRTTVVSLTRTAEVGR